MLFFRIVGRLWYEVHLYIANNLDWMEEWIERCIEFYGTLSWEGVSKLIKTVYRHREEYPGELTQRGIDLACGLKYKKASIFYTLIIFFRCFPLYKCISFFISSYKFIY